ncbi:MAG: hypothetical protein DHS20C18_29630 [Saprospiraceae bacterium]|nr:MAG: hypothetical protein DHS20C18_29630 [Saprospiraceae bacterium]
MAISENLIFHLPLNEHAEDKVIHNALQDGNIGSMQGNTMLIPDETFGAAISFDGQGDYLDCHNVYNPAAKPLSVSIWFNAAKTDAEHILFNKEDLFEAGIQGGMLRYAFQPHWDWDGANTFPVHIGIWYHVVVVYDGQKQYLYKDGVKVFERAQTGNIGANDSKLLIGARGHTNPHNFFQGKLAQFRMYDRALTAAEIQEIGIKDQVALATFHQSHPIEFDLLDNQKQPVLYIDEDPAGYQMHLNIKNKGRQNIQFSEVAHFEPSENTHHFALHFRPGTLHDDCFGTISVVNNQKWRMRLIPQADQSVIIYVLANHTPKIEVGSTETITFSNFRANGVHGTRGTRVELFYGSMAYEESTTWIKGRRLAHLNIVNHNGKKNIPLHIGFHGSNIVLNDAVNDSSGTANQLKLHLTNALQLDPANPDKSNFPLKGKDADSPTKFIISFDVQNDGEHKDWALGTKSQVANIEIRPTAIKVPGQADIQWSPAVVNPGEVFMLEQDVTLKAGANLEVDISNIKSSLPVGHTNLYLHYEDIPGYWNGQFVEVVEKSPLLFHSNAQGFEFVGIGTPEPEKHLHIKGSTAGGRFMNDVHDRPGLAISGAYPQIDLFSTDGNNTSHGPTLKFSAYNDANKTSFKNWSIGTSAADARFLDIGFSGASDNNPHAGIRNYNGRTVLTLLENGNVGIGNIEPTYKLDVYGSIRAHRYYDDDISFYIDANTTSVLNVVHASILYDREDTSYYIDPGYHSRLNRMDLDSGAGNSIIARNNGTGIVTIMALSEGNSKAIYAQNKGIGYPAIAAINLGNSHAIQADNNSPSFASVQAKNSHNSGWDFWAAGNNHYGRASSIRLKEDVSTVANALEKVLKLNGVRFKWKDSGTEDLGFIAEEAGKVIPEAVQFEDNGYATGMSYDHVLPLLVEAVKEQQGIIESLKEQIQLLIANKKNT